MEIPQVLRYTAFTQDPRGGNPAGVVVAAHPLDEATMQRVAADVGYSETAFLWPAGGDHDYEVRYFSPQREVAFCGHATVAAAVALAERDADLAGLLLATRHASVPVALDRSAGAVAAVLTTPAASHRPAPAALLDDALGCFGWDRGVLDATLPPALAHAGATHLVVALHSRADLEAMSYDFDGLARLMLDHDWTTVALVWRAGPLEFEARNAFAVGGVVEDPATGAAAAALGGYLRNSGAVPASARLRIRQGHHIGRPSLLEVSFPPAGDPRVHVAGHAVPVADQSR